MDIKELTDSLQRDWNEWKATQLARIAKGEKAADSVAELDAKLAKITASMDATEAALTASRTLAKSLEDRLNAAEADRDAIGPAKFSKAEDLKNRHANAYRKWLRTPRDNNAKQALQDVEREVQASAMATAGDVRDGKAGSTQVSTTGAAGGYSVPEILVAEVFEQQRLLSPIRQEVMNITAANTDIRLVLNLHGANSAWVAEASSRSQSRTPELREIVPTFGTLYAYVFATEESVNDIGFDIPGWLNREIAVEFASAEGIAMLSGNGTAKPTGMLNATTVTTNDDASPNPRAAAALEYFPLDTSSPSVGILAPLLMDIVYGLRSEYRANAKWAMNSVTLAAVRKLRDTTGQFLWQPSLQAGQPSTLCGYPVVVWEDMPSVGAAGRNVVLFGDFKRGYVLVDVAGVRTTLDDNITAPGYIKWYVRRRMGGIVLDNYAIKVGKTVAS